jgi:hypothetical protein
MSRPNTRSLAALNVVLAIVLIASLFRSTEAQDGRPPGDAVPVLRTRSLEIVDNQGRVRALLAVQPPATVDGRDYPETVLLRLVDPGAGPLVKLTAAANGSALSLSDDAEGGVQLYARNTGSFVRVLSKDGKEAVLKP